MEQQQQQQQQSPSCVHKPQEHISKRKSLTGKPDSKNGNFQSDKFDIFRRVACFEWL